MSSANYRELTTQKEIAEAAALMNAWQNPIIPEKQWGLIQKEIGALRRGEARQVAPFRSFLEACDSLPKKNDPYISILDVGASSGYYSEVLKRDGFAWRYTALDYSPAFKEFAAKIYPDVPFEVGDALNLPYPDASFDVVLSGCCLLHMYDWPQAVKETARVADSYAIFHRTPLLKYEKTKFWWKTAYDVPCLEIWFNHDEFMNTIQSAGLKYLAKFPTFENDSFGGYGHYTVVCEKL